ncbi:diacylglycerol kinase [Pseudoalteromonas phenolica]|uniref:Diacylglycerol kinase n=1 Tax=Pseudoalteromonas phenolica TaxID=161398 RepID=A0A5S3YPL4_9GAMM|nr:YegS/Rv2252/BmrU family lipid kinase [Pseudoalteromonas phenolica]TMP78111.1 diacylglycerol kinase [Pseudoalteromonas phenolica]
MLVVVKPNGEPGILKYKVWLEKECVLRNIECHWFYTSGSFGQDVLAIKSRLIDVKTVVVIGGDGTLHLVANAIAETDVALAVLPAGTGNDFSRQFNYNKQHWQSLVFSESTTKVDLGKINERYFINMAGIGFNAAVVKDMNTFKSRHKLSYIFSGIKQLFSFDKVSSNDVSLMAIFANGQYFAAGLKVAPSAHVKSGHLVKLHFKASHLLSRIWSFALMLIQQHEQSRFVSVETGTDFMITENGLIIEADGEIIGNTPAIIKCCPGALTIRL